MILALMDERALPASDLARVARVTPQTASTHLAKLREAGFVHDVRQGRHRYFRLASAEIARAVESLSAIAPLPKVRSLNQSLRVQRLDKARTCYDHLAGELGVGIADALVARGDLQRLDDGFIVTPSGVAFFATFGIDARALCKGNPPFVRSCIDWTRRRQHMSGPLGKALLQALLKRGWIARSQRNRVIDVAAKDQLDMLFFRREQTPSANRALRG